MRAAVCLLVSACLWACIALAEINTDEIHLISGKIDVSDAPLLARAHFATRAIDSTRQHQFLVHLEGSITEDLKARVNAALAPAYLSQYIPENTFVVHSTPEHMLRFAENRPAEVSWVGEMPSAAKVSLELTHRVHESRVHNREVHPEGDAAPVELHVSFPVDVETRTLEEAHAIGALWKESIQHYPGTTLEVVSKDVAIVKTPADLAEKVAATLAAEPECQWVESRGVFKTLNLWTRQLLQGGTIQSSSTVLGTTPLTALGLDGTGMTIGVGDSGMDMSHCFFADTVTTPLYPTVNNGHRKVATYDAYVDSYDSAEADGGGHGTHVCGTLAGNPTTGSRATLFKDIGMAPAAKIAIIDIGATTGSALGSLSIPSDVYGRYFVSAYTAGARIHSNSWGSSPVVNGAKTANTYTTTARDFDRFIFANNDFIALVAAGNDGEYGDNTIGSPAVAKNVITVGATSASLSAWQGYCCLNGQTPCWLQPGYSCTQDFLNLLSGSPQMFTENDMASFSSRGPISVDQRSKPDVSAPGYQTLSSQSNGSPTTPQCTNTALDSDALTMKAGTSMATPTTSGSLAVLRQYLTEGWYPTGVKTAANAFSPSGALMKALLIAGAKPMAGYITNNGVSEGTLPTTYPNKNSGNGRIALDRTMYVNSIGGTTRQKIFMAAGNTDNSLATGATNTHCVTALTTERLRFALVWTDPAAAASAAKALINNLDLKVDLPAGGGTLNGNGGAAADTINNVEIVDIATPTVGAQYCARVIGSSVTQNSPQKYALVAVGGVDPTATSTSTTTTTGTTKTGTSTTTTTKTGTSTTTTKTGTSTTTATTKTGTTTANPTTQTGASTTTADPTTATSGTSDPTTTPTTNDPTTSQTTANPTTANPTTANPTSAPAGTTSTTAAATADAGVVGQNGGDAANSGGGIAGMSTTAVVGAGAGIVIVVIVIVVVVLAVVTMRRRAAANKRAAAANTYREAKGSASAPAQDFEAQHARPAPAAPAPAVAARPAPGAPVPNRPAPGAPAPNRASPGRPSNGPPPNMPPKAPRPAPGTSPRY